MKPTRSAELATALCLLSLLGASCSSTPTYYQDVQPIIQSKCEGCHNVDGIGPFPFQTANDVVSRKDLVKSVVTTKVMPPWPPSDSCNSYQVDRSLSASEIKTITDWIDAGAPLGDSKSQKTGTPFDGMSRVDFTVQMPQAFTPIESPDDYRCFMLDWSPTTETYVTGFGVKPGHAPIVHHAIAYIAPPSQVAAYQALDGTDGHPGWTCFGGPGGGHSGLGTLTSAQWLGAWAPGALGNDFPAGTGVKIQPGSKIILQIHYNTSVNPPAPDQTTLEFETADSVQNEAFVMPFVDPAWLRGGMDIPANAADTMHNYSIDPTPYMSLVTNGVLGDDISFTVYMSFLHMHTRGSAISGQINRSDGSKECLLDIPQWSFNWQGGYTFAKPKTFYPGDQLYLECHWNNTAANQPVINGVQVTPHDLNWGETTEDEMCLEILYLTQ